MWLVKHFVFLVEISMFAEHAELYGQGWSGKGDSVAKS